MHAAGVMRTAKLGALSADVGAQMWQLHVDAATRLDGVPFDGPRALGSVLRQSDGAVRCLTRSLFRQAVGRVESRSEEPSLQEVDQRFAASGHRMKSLLVELVLSKAFLNVAEVQ